MTARQGETAGPRGSIVAPSYAEVAPSTSLSSLLFLFEGRVNISFAALTGTLFHVRRDQLLRQGS